jgi:UDP-3-O-[3-hydroxymyristoyl] N-acetylglucosamine deacetylase
LSQQQTISRPIIMTGQALMSGANVQMELTPMPPDSGIQFSRKDLGNSPVRIDPGLVMDTRKCVAIGNESWRIQTIEHFMAALHGIGIDNLLIEVDGEELPRADGSALEFATTMKNVGLIEQGKPRRIRKVKEPVWVENDNDPRAYLVALPGDGLKITYCFTSDHPATGNQFFQYTHSPENFLTEIAGARTIAFEREIEALKRQGLGLGGNLDAVILVGDDGYKNSLRYPEEIVRHKILDILGDLYLTGPFEGQIIAVRSGHRLDVELAAKLHKEMNERGTMV